MLTSQKPGRKDESAYIKARELLKEAERQGESGQPIPTGEVWTAQGEMVTKYGPNSGPAKLLLNAFDRGRRKC